MLTVDIHGEPNVKPTKLERIVSEIVRVESLRQTKIALLPIVDIYNSYEVNDPRLMREIYDYMYFSEFKGKPYASGID